LLEIQIVSIYSYFL